MKILYTAFNGKYNSSKILLDNIIVEEDLRKMVLMSLYLKMQEIIFVITFIIMDLNI